MTHAMTHLGDELGQLRQEASRHDGGVQEGQQRGDDRDVELRHGSGHIREACSGVIGCGAGGDAGDAVQGDALGWGFGLFGAGSLEQAAGGERLSGSRVCGLCAWELEGVMEFCMVGRFDMRGGLWGILGVVEGTQRASERALPHLRRAVPARRCPATAGCVDLDHVSVIYPQNLCHPQPRPRVTSRLINPFTDSKLPVPTAQALTCNHHQHKTSHHGRTRHVWTLAAAGREFASLTGEEDAELCFS